ncbi:hypothetical protein HMPREF0742_01205 [Rothia aeria F0184]|uniref:Uncharacterized protein n=1 Tax=Rothia aeria F0184 TaxID=888019 RepID=U7V4W4_9MICC|nr:hypothetical protein HMPREF0742_01205 [Rothia aeria F0184]
MHGVSGFCRACGSVCSFWFFLLSEAKPITVLIKLKVVLNSL